jgi:uncharacterized protein YndB with AHSA1/START domain
MPRVDRASSPVGAAPAWVYRALVDPELLVLWLPPDGAQARIDRLEARPGGRIAITLSFAAGAGGKTTADTDLVEGFFVDLEPERLVSQRFTFSSRDPAFAGEMLMTWRLEEGGSGTIVTVTAENVPAAIPADVHERAMASSLAKLAALAAAAR